MTLFSQTELQNSFGLQWILWRFTGFGFLGVVLFVCLFLRTWYLSYKKVFKLQTHNQKSLIFFKPNKLFRFFLLPWRRTRCLFAKKVGCSILARGWHIWCYFSSEYCDLMDHNMATNHRRQQEDLYAVYSWFLGIKECLYMTWI